MTNPTLKPPELPRRFYTDATVAPADGGYFRILLDGRSVRTPGRNLLQLPGMESARQVAAEWQAQGERIDPSTMPLTRLVNTVIDGIAPDPAPTRQDLARYVETDLLAYRADTPERLVRRQAELWDPLIEWAAGRIGGTFATAAGIMYVAQPPQTVERFRAVLMAIADPFIIGALHQMTTLTGSAILALAVAEGRLDAAQAFAAAHVEEDWNIEMWGDDAEASARRAARARDMAAAALLVQMPANHS